MAQRLHTPIRGFATAYTIGIILGLGITVLLCLGRVRVRGYWRAVKEASKGRLIIAANHPSGAETFVVPALFCPWYFIRHRYFVWSMPRKGLVPRTLEKTLRCIPVDKNAGTMQRAIRVLQEGGVVFAHPEGMRTVKGSEFREEGERRLVRIKTALPLLARKANARILALYIEMRDVTQEMYFWKSIAHLFGNGRYMTLYFAKEAFTFSDDVPLDEANRLLEDRILAS